MQHYQGLRDFQEIKMFHQDIDFILLFTLLPNAELLVKSTKLSIFTESFHKTHKINHLVLLVFTTYTDFFFYLFGQQHFLFR